MSKSGTFLGQLAERYATALFELARDDGSLSIIAKNLSDIAHLTQTDPDLRTVVLSPVIAREAAGRAMGAVLGRMGVHTTTRNFVGVLADKRRLFLLPLINKAFHARLAEMKGEMQAEIVSAQPLKDAQLTQLKGALRDAYKRDVQLHATVDPGLIGGFVIKARSRHVDFSIRAKLQALETALKGA